MNLATLSFRDITANEVEMVCQIVKPSFAEHVSPHYFREGRNDFLKTIEPEVIKTRLERGNSIYIAQRGHQVEGVIEFQSDNQILHFYIEPKEIEQGIGRKLFEYALGMRRWITPEIQKITVNASPTAVSLFQALGFRAESEERFINDGRFLPMAYVLEPIKLVLPSTEYKESFIAGNEEFRNSREEYVNISTDFEAYIIYREIE